MKTISKSKYVLIALLVAFSYSCSPEDGKDGAPGQQGTTGQDGKDGNANVQTFIFDTSDKAGIHEIELNLPAITKDVIDNGAILTYYVNENGRTISIPGLLGVNLSARVYAIEGRLFILFLRSSGHTYKISAGEIQKVKVIIIGSSKTTQLRTEVGNQEIYNGFDEAGVDITNYQEVYDYYGITN